MIDSELGSYFAISEVPNRIPKTSRGRRVSIATVVRWSTKGLKGIKLETIRIGGTRCTCDDALRRFFERISQSQSGRTPSPALLTATQRNRRFEAVEERLNELGI
jgi:hypothetical protein